MKGKRWDTLPAVPPQFSGQARRLLDTLRKVDQLWVQDFEDKLDWLRDHRRASRAETAKFVRCLELFSKFGVLGFDVNEQKHRTVITYTRARACRHWQESWDMRQPAIQVTRSIVTIRPDFVDHAYHEPLSIGLHGIARAFQRMPRVSDDAVLEGLNTVLPMWSLTMDVGESFVVSGWRGSVDRQVVRGSDTEYEPILAIRTYLAKEDDDD